MLGRSIGTRLTIWYTTALAAGLLLFAVAIWLTMWQSLKRDLDHDLALHMTSIASFLREELLDPKVTLTEELAEYSHALPEGTEIYVVSPGVRGKAILFTSRPDFPWSELQAGFGAPLSWRGDSYRGLSKTLTVAGAPWQVTFVASLNTSNALLSRLRFVLIVLSPGVMLIAALGGRWLSRRALRPVDEITATARQIGIQNLSLRLKVPQTGDELQRLSETWNAMLERLEAAVGRLSRFTADASHELRTPLAVIRGTAEIAARQVRPAENYRSALAKVVSESGRMTVLIDDLLFLARSDTDRFELHMELLYFDELVREACLAIRPVAEAKLVHLQTAIGDAALPAIGNPASLRRLMWALIDNAVKYTEPGGSVSVSVEKAKDNICLKVADDGPGIPDSELPFLFERFYRGFYAKENGKSGAGLGLALANTIAKMHDSSIQVRSAVGRGSVFEVNIPSVMHDQANGLLSGCQLPSAEP